MSGMTNRQKLQAVINTLETLDIKPTYDNANKLLGVYQTLAGMRDEIDDEEAADDAGEADAE